MVLDEDRQGKRSARGGRERTSRQRRVDPRSGRDAGAKMGRKKKKVDKPYWCAASPIAVRRASAMRIRCTRRARRTAQWSKMRTGPGKRASAVRGEDRGRIVRRRRGCARPRAPQIPGGQGVGDARVAAEPAQGADRCRDARAMRSAACAACVQRVAAGTVAPTEPSTTRRS